MTGLAVAVISGFALAAVAPLFARSRHAGWVLALLPAGLAAYFLALAPRVISGERIREVIDWVPGLGLQFSLALDGLGLLFALLVCGVGALVVVYAGGYLAGHPQLGRFYAVILVFMASMLGIVVADNLLLLYTFWGLTSVTSYLLISFDHERLAARTSAQQALLVTVGGELAMLAGLVMLGIVGRTTQISELLERGDVIRADPLYLPILGLILAGALTKSAQFPFQFWLPNAMAAPAPVSAYLHSATMVKAGIFLLFRLTPVLAGTDAWTLTLVASGGVTMLIGAFLAYRANEVKRVLAYSTVSALGLMTMLLGIGTELAVIAAVVFLLGHALYKGTLFLFAGAADHEAGATETSQLSGLRRHMPISATAALLAGLSMAGLLPFFGFIGKELTFDAVLHLPGLSGPLLLAAAIVANALLVVVAVRIGVRPFIVPKDVVLRRAHEAPVSLWLGPILLAGLGVTSGVMPGLLATPLVASAVAAIRGQPTPVELVLWHGFNVVLAFSVVTLLVGAALYYWRAPIRRATARLDVGPWVGPEAAYRTGMQLIQRGAELQTRLLQDGYLRHYLLITTATATLLVGGALLRAGGVDVGLGRLELRPTEVGLAALILVAALVAVRARSRLGTVAALGVAGYGVALIFLTFGAPDLALTQVLIETLTVIVFVLVLYHLPPFVERSGGRVRDAIVSIAFGALMTSLVLATLTTEGRQTISRFFIDEALPQAHGRNVVNVILVDFRALDTMGEIAVLSLAGLGVLVLLRIRGEHRARR